MAAKNKYIVGIVHSRGGGCTELTSAKFHQNSISDTIEEVEFIYDKLGKSGLNYNLFGIGMSMGANHLVKYCGTRPDHCKFKALVSFSNPYDVWASINMMRGS